MTNKDDAEKMVGRAVIEAMKRSAQAREIFKRILGDVMENVPMSETGYKDLAVDVMENPDEIVIFADLPGSNKENIDLSVTEDSVAIEVKFERTEGHYLIQERSKKSLSRELKLTEEVKPEQITAKYDNGVLEIHLPKLIVVKPHEVNIN